LSDLPWLLPGLVVAVIVAFLAGPAVGRALQARAATGMAIVWSLGLILAATLTPLVGAITSSQQSGGICDLTVSGPRSISDFITPNEISLNVLLFVPLGAALGVLPRSRLRSVLIGAGMLLPFAIEYAQLIFPVLDRACELSDVIYNCLGFVAGLSIGWVGANMARMATAKQDQHIPH
jgi:glycopeptide antibiotics resistance protein